MTRARRLIPFVLVAVLQLVATTSSIARYEHTLASGQPLRFRLAPVDPVDPLRGYYVAFRFAEESPTTATVDSDVDPDAFLDADVFVTLRVDEEGFARVAHVTAHRPSSVPYLRATLVYRGDGAVPPRLNLPFDRFYTGKAAAASVQQAFFGGPRPTDAFAVVRVLDGRGIIESLVVDGKDVRRGRTVR